MHLLHTPLHGAESTDTSKLACMYTASSTCSICCTKPVIVYIGQKNCRDISQVIGRGSASTVCCMRVWGCLMGMHVCAENVSRIIGDVTAPLLCSLSPFLSDLYIVKTKIHILRAKWGHFWEEDWTVYGSRVTVLIGYQFDSRKRTGKYILSLSLQIDRCTSMCILAQAI